MALNITDLTKAEAEALAAIGVSADKAQKVMVARHGGSAPATPDEIELIREYLEALREETRLDNLKKTIKGLLEESMVERGIKALTYADLTVVAMSPTTRTTRNWAGLEEDYPKIAEQYTESEPTTRMDFKKNIIPGI